MTLLEIMIAIVVFVMLVVSSGGILAALARQSDLNRQMAVVDSEVSNALSLIHTAPFDSIGNGLVTDGYQDLGSNVFRKDLAGDPTELTDGQLNVTLRNVTGVPLPDPLFIDVVISWDCPPGGLVSRQFVTVRTR
jgi:hypothetical protein